MTDVRSCGVMEGHVGSWEVMWRRMGTCVILWGHIKNPNCGNDRIKKIPKVAFPHCKKILKIKEMLKVHVKQMENQVMDKGQHLQCQKVKASY